MKLDWEKEIQAFDERRDVCIPGSVDETIQFCVDHFIEIAKTSIAERGNFAVALSGGSTPKAIYQLLAQSPIHETVDWSRVWLFWSDERAVPPTDEESNYHMAITSGFSALPIPPENIYRMNAEKNIEENAKAYDALLRTKLPDGAFDLVMLGMGEDGHTASLFPKTHGLHTSDRLAIANFIPQKDTWRMSLTFDCINAARNIVIYVLGANKAEMVRRVLNGQYDPDQIPIQRVGTASHKALWVLDKAAGRLM